MALSSLPILTEIGPDRYPPEVSQSIKSYEEVTNTFDGWGGTFYASGGYYFRGGYMDGGVYTLYFHWLRNRVPFKKLTFVEGWYGWFKERDIEVL